MFLKDDALILHGLTDSIVGASDCGRLVYDYRKVIDIFMKKNDWSEEEAIEWMEFNVVGAYVGKDTPIFVVKERIEC